MNYKNKKITVMGLGMYPQGSGISAVKFLYNKGAEILVTDLRSADELKNQLSSLEEYTGITYVLGEHREEDFQDVDMIVKNPAVPESSKFLAIAKENNIPIENDITLFMREVTVPVIGVTGTRGKSTTSTLLHEMLKKKFDATFLGGNITVSPLQFIDKVTDSQPVVLELSSWLLHELKYLRQSPQMAIVTNMMVDHLNRYDSFEQYKEDKSYIYSFQREQDIAIFNKDNKHTWEMSKEAVSQVYYFSHAPLHQDESGVFIDKEGNVVWQEETRQLVLLHENDIPLPGTHMKENVMAAICAAMLSGVSAADIVLAIREFKGVSSRLEVVKKINDITFVNDTTATMPDAAKVAMETYPNAIVLAGGTNKELDLDVLVDALSVNAKSVILLPGTATDYIKDKLPQKLQPQEVSSMKEAVAVAYERAEGGDTILLSPGAASFGLFVNEFDRGEQFIKYINKLS